MTLPNPNPPLKARATRWRRAGFGLVFGVLLAFGALQLIRNVVPLIGDDILIPLLAVGGALLALTRAWKLLGWAAILVVAGIAVVGYTPLADMLIRTVIRSDTLQPAPAIVVLAASIQRDGEMGSTAQARILQGYELLGQGFAPRLVLTRLAWKPYSYLPTVERQMRRLGLDYPVEEVGPVSNTHDEAVAAARLARQRGWREVILVTHPWHMRRAAGVFEKAGLRVHCSPCVEGRYDLSRLGSPSARLTAFRDWAHEAIGYWVYRGRGWL